MYNGGQNIKTGAVYKYVDTDNIVKYVGLVKPGNSLLKRIEQHKGDSWYHDEYTIYYIELETQTDCEFCESFFINHYKTYNYYNTAKSSWGGSSFINSKDFEWKLFHASDFINEYVSPRKKNRNDRKVTNHIKHEALSSDSHSYSSIVKIPSEIITDNSLGKKRITFTIAIQLLKDKSGNVYTSMKRFVMVCGYKYDTHGSKINSEIKDFLNAINGVYIKDLNMNRCISFNVLKSLEEPFRFAMIRLLEFEKINNTAKAITRSLSLLVLAYIRLNIYHNNSQKSKRPEIFFDHLNNIIEKLGCIDYRSLRNILGILDECDIIYHEEIKRYKDEYNNWHSGVTVFVEKYNSNIGSHYDYVKEMDKAKRYIQNLQQNYINNAR